MSLLDQVLSTKPNVSFSSYYKFSFNFQGKTTLPNGNIIQINASLGGSADEIYSLSISTTTQELLSKDTFNYISVENLTTGESENWNTY